MGVPKIFKMFISIIEGINITNVNGIFGLMIDLNGFIHKCSGAVFGYNKSLLNMEIDPEIKKLIRQKLKTKQGFELLKAEFLNSLGSALEEIIINQIKPSDILIMAIDGKAPFAKVNQQRMRRMDAGFNRWSYNPASDTISAEEKFDTAYLTAGTQFMRDVSNTIRSWINANKARLPYYTLFSGSDFQGEGEHKIFKMLEDVKNYILTNDTTITKKDKEATFRSQKFVVYGLDADLGILSMMRDYNFIWVREQFSIKKMENGTNIDIARSHIISSMKPLNENITKEQKTNIIIDFAFMSFLIGDDFVPAMFPLTINIKIALDRFMEKYAFLFGTEFNFLLSSTGDINIQNFTNFIHQLEEVERELYKMRQEVDLAERTLSSNFGNEEAMNKVKEFRNFLRIKIDDRETYTPSPILKLSYEEYVEYWKRVLVRPSLMSNKLAQSDKISYLLNFDKDLLDQECDDSCQDYITGLQWNIKYYMGYEMNNWYYKKPFPPTIHSLIRFLKSGKYIPINVIRQPTDPIISTTQCLITVLNPNFSSDVLKTFFKNDKAYQSATINCSYLNTMFPKKISHSFQGKYHSEEHTKIPLLPPIIFEDILKIIPSTKNEINDINFYDFILGSTESSFSRLLKSTIGFGRNDEIKVFNKETLIRGPGSPVRPRSSSPIGGRSSNIIFGNIKPPTKTFNGEEDTTQIVSQNMQKKIQIFNERKGGRGAGQGRGQEAGRGRRQEAGRGRGQEAGRTQYRNDRSNFQQTLQVSMKVGKLREIIISKKIGDDYI